MEQYKGVISVRLQNVASKSEGHYAFLVQTSEDERLLKLCREGEPYSDDPFFVSYDGQRVVVRGSISHGWLVVEGIEPDTEEEIEEENQENSETEQ